LALLTAMRRIAGAFKLAYGGRLIA